MGKVLSVFGILMLFLLMVALVSWALFSWKSAVESSWVITCPSGKWFSLEEPVLADSWISFQSSDGDLVKADSHGCVIIAPRR